MPFALMAACAPDASTRITPPAPSCNLPSYCMRRLGDRNVSIAVHGGNFMCYDMANERFAMTCAGDGAAVVPHMSPSRSADCLRFARATCPSCHRSRSHLHIAPACPLPRRQPSNPPERTRSDQPGHDRVRRSEVACRSTSCHLVNSDVSGETPRRRHHRASRVENDPSHNAQAGSDFESS